MSGDEQLECINNPTSPPGAPADCRGAVEYRLPLSGSGKSFPRCEKHWDERLEIEDRINQRYPSQQPSDFDPAYAGESWYED